MTTYRVGTHHGVTINREGDGHRCDRPGHDCARGHLVAVVTNEDQELAERICALLNGTGGVETYACPDCGDDVSHGDGHVCADCGAPFGSGQITCKRPPHTPDSKHAAGGRGGTVQWW